MRSEYDASMTQSVLASGSGAAAPRKTANVMPRVKNRIILPTVLAVFLPAALTFPVMLGPAIGADFESLLIGTGVTISGTMFHWWLSSRLEHALAKRHTLWKDEPFLLVSVFYKANGLSYGLISLLLLVGLIKQLLDYTAKT